MCEQIKSDEITAIRVLLVDDDLDFLLSLKMELGKQYKVMTAEDGIEAKLMLECRNDFDLIISDQSMPAMDGIELFEWVGREHPQTPKVLLAELNELTDEIKSQANQNEFYCLNKSSGLKELVTAVDQAIIGVKPVVMSLFNGKNASIENKSNSTEIKPASCKMAVLDANTKNWATFDNLTKQSDHISDVVYFRNPALLMERLKKDSSLGVVCINFKKKKSATNDVIEQISQLKHPANVILICGIDQASAAVEYQFKGKIYQRVIKPGPASKMLFEIECAAKKFMSETQTAKVVVDPSFKSKSSKQPDSQLTQALH